MLPDEQSNQTIEMALRHLWFENEQGRGTGACSCQCLKPSSTTPPSATIGLCPNEIVLGSKVREGNALLDGMTVPESLASLRETNRRQAQDAIAYADRCSFRFVYPTEYDITTNTACYNVELPKFMDEPNAIPLDNCTTSNIAIQLSISVDKKGLGV